MSGEKPLGAKERTNNKHNPHMPSTPGFEPGPHLWEASALTTVPSLAPPLSFTLSYVLKVRALRTRKCPTATSVIRRDTQKHKKIIAVPILAPAHTSPPELTGKKASAKKASFSRFFLCLYSEASFERTPQLCGHRAGSRS